MTNSRIYRYWLSLIVSCSSLFVFFFLLACTEGREFQTYEGDVSPDAICLDDGVLMDGDTTDANEGEKFWDQSDRIKPQEGFDRCSEIETPEGYLLGKAQYYDWVARKIHLLHIKDYSLVHNVLLKEKFPGEILDKDYEVEYYDDSDNHGLWSSLYIASQVFRYLVTNSPEALDNLRVSYRGLYNLFKVSASYGLPARDFRDNSISGYECPSNPEEYTKPVNRTGNKYVVIDEKGCLKYFDSDKKEWRYDEPTVCVDEKFSNMCFKRNTSKDEIAGHLFVSSLIFRFIEDAELKSMAKEVLSSMAQHLIKNDFVLKDYDGMKTKYGSYYALSLDEVPGFNAVGALSVIRAGLVASQDDAIKKVYYECLLQKNGKRRCINQPIEYDSPEDYREYLKDGFGMSGDCKSINFDNVNMVFLNAFSYVTMLGVKEERYEIMSYFLKDVSKPDGSGRYLLYQVNPHFNFIVLSLLEESDALSEEMIERLIDDSLCSLKKFPETNVKRFIDNREKYSPACQNSSGEGFAADVIPVDERCAEEFLWWRDPYKIRVCEGDERFGYNPASYLLPYWMGRYYGFISERD